jgi:hypothetical protein
MIVLPTMIVEGRDDEACVGDVDVEADRREKQPREPADREEPDEARILHPRLHDTAPRYIVAVQLNTLTADDRDQKTQDRKSAPIH